MARKLAEVNRRFAPAHNEPVAATEQRAERKREPKKCRHLHKPKTHGDLVRRVGQSAGVLYGLPNRTVQQVLNTFLKALRDDLILGDSYILRGVGVLSSRVRESAPRGKWKWRAARMLRAELHLRSSRALRVRMKKHHRFNAEMERTDAEALARHRLRQMGLAKFGSGSIYRDARPSAAKNQQQPPNK
ncbi:MAG: hypothetical protein DPW14_05610 [Planctomycetes bacterium]|nr:hypothetical protein [Planctomycetota bacterium]